MTLANFDYEFEYAIMFTVALYFHIAAWHGHRTAVQGQEIGYATILTWLRASAFMVLSAFLWIFMFEETIAFQSAVGLGILGPLQWVFLGLFWLNLVVGIVITLYLVLPTERLPKAFDYFTKPKTSEPVERE